LELRDLIVTPILLILVYFGAYLVRPYLTDNINKIYFFPALTARIIGALAVGFIYQFYYDGGDTFAFHTHGSRHIWEAMMESPVDGLRLLFSNGEYGPGLWNVSEKIWYWKDANSFFVIRIAAIFDILTFSSYSGTAVLFAVVAFAGSWLLFSTFYKESPDFHKGIAISVFFIPTVIFWGSGIFKDSLTLAALGVATYCGYMVLIRKKYSAKYMIILLVACWVIYSLKIYILISFFPAILIWWFTQNIRSIRPFALRLVVTPFMVLVTLTSCYFVVSMVTENDLRYNIYKLAETAKITAYDIRYGWGARGGEGSGYTLGELDGTWQSMILLAPKAVNVSLFRPYLWEVKNPLMLLSALEGLMLLVFTLYIIITIRSRLFFYLQKPGILFCLFFSLMFSFAVGISTFNFGSLSRYKIPMMPYYLLALVMIYYYWKRDRKMNEAEVVVDYNDVLSRPLR
jgi:hypothetical protein